MGERASLTGQTKKGLGTISARTLTIEWSRGKTYKTSKEKEKIFKKTARLGQNGVKWKSQVALIQTWITRETGGAYLRPMGLIIEKKKARTKNGRNNEKKPVEKKRG